MPHAGARSRLHLRHVVCTSPRHVDPSLSKPRPRASALAGSHGPSARPSTPCAMEGVRGRRRGDCPRALGRRRDGALRDRRRSGHGRGLCLAHRDRARERRDDAARRGRDEAARRLSMISELRETGPPSCRAPTARSLSLWSKQKMHVPRELDRGLNGEFRSKTFPRTLWQRPPPPEHIFLGSPTRRSTHGDHESTHGRL